MHSHVILYEAFYNTNVEPPHIRRHRTIRMKFSLSLLAQHSSLLWAAITIIIAMDPWR